MRPANPAGTSDAATIALPRPPRRSSSPNRGRASSVARSASTRTQRVRSSSTSASVTSRPASSTSTRSKSGAVSSIRWVEITHVRGRSACSSMIARVSRSREGASNPVCGSSSRVSGARLANARDACAAVCFPALRRRGWADGWMPNPSSRASARVRSKWGRARPSPAMRDASVRSPAPGQPAPARWTNPGVRPRSARGTRWTWASPVNRGSRPARTRSRVVLPAPLRPRSPTMLAAGMIAWRSASAATSRPGDR